MLYYDTWGVPRERRQLYRVYEVNPCFGASSSVYLSPSFSVYAL